MAAFLLPSWQLDFSGPREKALTVHEIRQKKRLSVKRKVKRKVKFAHQLHRLIKVFLPSPSRSKPTTQVRGSLQYRSPSPFPRGRVAEEVDEIKEQPEGDVLDAPPRPASRTSDASTSMWGVPISYLDGARQSRSPSRPASQDVQARHEVKVTTPPTLEARPQTAAIEQMLSNMVNDKTPLLGDTITRKVDTTSEEEDIMVTARIQKLNPHSSSKMPAINSTRPLQYLGVNQDDISFDSVSCGSQSSNRPLLTTGAAKNRGWLPLPRHRHSNYSSSRASYGVSSSTTINTGEASLLRRGAVADSRNRSGYDALPHQAKSEPSLPSSSYSAGPSSLPAGTSIPSPVTYSVVAAVNEAQHPQNTPYPRQNNMSQESIKHQPCIGSASLKFSGGSEVGGHQAISSEAQEANLLTTNRIWPTNQDTGPNLRRLPSEEVLFKGNPSCCAHREVTHDLHRDKIYPTVREPKREADHGHIATQFVDDALWPTPGDSAEHTTSRVKVEIISTDIKNEIDRSLIDENSLNMITLL
ncbi:hypothetical protein SMACR_03258 [Sordaria macrospora]|uniref:WGS project CABT00000000 data, contig 2.10 n=2 Tax=Sordaria macrospora TaxID=5147 RepID=F7VWD0_SORMK|nr:uncharacterized protein SMAC_03258 [Sordaria macrospora k-hell]KAA8635680.1 hypothetical protein SMACR_03258 [Sordaria macrospora]WPJ66785.1 hypothetical protein SMAC4_03258 [Sordaria macrospora]CCC09698.1 unnamed protein product [Sordaria macrospora k-hell]